MLQSLVLNKERKIILIAGAFLLVLGVFYRFYPDLVAMVATSDEIAMKRHYIEKYRKVLSLSGPAKKENEYYKRQVKQITSMLSTGKTPTLAAVEIQNILNDIAEQNQIKFESMRVMKSIRDDTSPFLRIPVLFSISSDIRQLKDFLYQVETSNKLLVITKLSADTARFQDHQKIRATIIVEGVMKAQATEG